MIRVTAAGSLPGDDFRGALTAMTELLPDPLPWPELPDRGIGSDMIGRALGVIDDLGFDLQPAGWRLIHGTGADHRRARAQWRRDLDDAEELLQGFPGPLKIALAGPWTLAATVERPNGDRLLADHGARDEVAQALHEGWARLRAELARRLPGVEVILQVDEPMLVAVGQGDIDTSSGFSRHRAVHRDDLTAALAPFRDGAWLHCCAPGDWLVTAERAGFRTAAVDSRLFRGAGIDRLVEWAQGGGNLALGVVDTASGRVQPIDAVLAETLRVLRPLELGTAAVVRQVVLTTACGMAGWRIPDIPRQLESLREAARLAPENLVED
ncbi:methionine synthase [Arachnia propionica]|uniref:Methionine synthase n=1 Tax=Arachnia propionica TaxID=1750 RepID=A0A3P1TCW3_9ACTN|nr:methionine synthase [Arachnia propionica]RRD07269.1 methionine synthase [Arachnia propionica]